MHDQLRVKSQTSLTIAPGVVIFEENPWLCAILVEPGGRIWAVATACDPIIITSDDVLLGDPFARGHCGGYSFIQGANFTLVGDRRSGAAFPGSTSGINWRRGTAYSIDDATWRHRCHNVPAVPGQFRSGALSLQSITGGNGLVANRAANPIRNRVAISTTLPRASAVEVHMYSADGRLVKTL